LREGQAKNHAAIFVPRVDDPMVGHARFGFDGLSNREKCKLVHPVVLTLGELCSNWGIPSGRQPIAQAVRYRAPRMGDVVARERAADAPLKTADAENFLTRNPALPRLPAASPRLLPHMVVNHEPLASGDGADAAVGAIRDASGAHGAAAISSLLGGLSARAPTSQLMRIAGAGSNAFIAIAS